MTAVTPAIATVVPQTAATGPRWGWLRDRGMGASVLVAALSAGFGVLLVEMTAYIGAALQADPFIGNSETLAIVVGLLSVLLTAVAMYVAAIVTANTFSTIIAGRTRQIALMRLVGATARSQRAEVGKQGLVVGVIGAVLGLLAGLLLSALGVYIGGQLMDNAPAEFTLAQPFLVLPAVGVALTTWVAAWIGSRRVLSVTPLQAIGGSVERTHEDLTGRPGRHVGAWVLLISGAALLAAGVVVGLITPLGVVVAFLGGVLSFTGLALGSVLFMPPVLRLVGRMFGASATARLAAENALRYPERSSRMAIGVVMGVTLVTMFAVALESAKRLMMNQQGDVPDEFFAPFDAFASVMMVLVAVSAVIAAVGLVNLLTIGVVQRRRELGLLRSIGLSNRQVRRMVLLEATHITVASTLTGLVLGIVYGWIAAQSVLGSVPTLPDFTPAGLVAPQIPWVPVVIIVVATALLTLVAAAAPTRLATRVAPVEALAAD